MKILILGFAKIKYMPYLNLYLDNIDAGKNEVHLMYWDRDKSPDKDIDKKLRKHIFSQDLEDEIPKYKKIGAVLKFAKAAKRLIKKEEFDFIIALTSIPAVLISDILLNEYKGRYIFDYRDFTFENISLYKRRIAELVKNSCFTAYSSQRHLKFLPESKKLFIAHNFTKDSLFYRNKKEEINKKQDEPIRLSYWGILRDYAFNKKIIDRLGKDKRFLINFYGKKQKTVKYLEKYCQENNITNVKFFGEYQETDRYDFVKNTDILYNLYNITGTEGMAMGNKFFDGVIFYLPQICTKGSFMGENAEKYGVGKALDPDSIEFADDIYTYYNSIDKTLFKNNCDILADKIVKDLEVIAKKIKESCNSK